MNYADVKEKSDGEMFDMTFTANIFAEFLKSWFVSWKMESNGLPS